MIKSFLDKRTESFYSGKRVKEFSSFSKQLERKLEMLNSTATLDDLRVLPGNRLEALLGNRKGQYSIRINHQWRLCFCFENGNAYEVEVADYH